MYSRTFVIINNNAYIKFSIYLFFLAFYVIIPGGISCFNPKRLIIFSKSFIISYLVLYPFPFYKGWCKLKSLTIIYNLRVFKTLTRSLNTFGILVIYKPGGGLYILYIYTISFLVLIISIIKFGLYIVAFY